MQDKSKSISDKYEVGLMVVSVAIIAFIVAGLTVFPVEGVQIAHWIMNFLTHNLGTAVQVLAIGIFIMLIAICFTKYGDIRFGNKRPKYSTLSWVGMMFFCGNGAGTVYWAFLEWGHFFNSRPLLYGSEISEAYNYEQSLSYSFFHWGPIAWALLCVFVLPFAYHYYIKKDDELKFSVLCKYTVGEKAVRGFFGKVVDFLFIFAAVGSIAITAGSSASSIGAAISELTGIPNTFAMSVVILVAVAVLYSVTSLLGIEKGMKKISDSNIYLCFVLLIFIMVCGPTRQIIDTIFNSLGLMFNNMPRMATWTDPMIKSGFPQDWTCFYWIYWFVFGPFTGLFVAKISEGRTVREIIINMLVSGSAGLVLFFGVIGAYEQSLRMDGVLDVPGMIASGQAEEIAAQVINTLPFSRLAIVLYLFVIVLFLATTLDACSFTLSSTVTKSLKADEEPGKIMRFAWCLILIGIPIAIAYVGTDIDTIKAIVLATGIPLVVLFFIMYAGLYKEVKNHFGSMSRDDIIKQGAFSEESSDEAAGEPVR